MGEERCMHVECMRMRVPENTKCGVGVGYTSRTNEQKQPRRPSVTPLLLQPSDAPCRRAVGVAFLYVFMARETVGKYLLTL